MKLVKILYNFIQKKQVFLLLVTLISILSVGYYFGTFDQAIHIPFLKKMASPGLFPGDKFFDLRFQHYSYFWQLFLPLYNMGILEPTLFVVHLLVTYLTFYSIWTVTETLFKDELVSKLSVLSLMLPHLVFGGFPMIEFQILNRTVVLPFLLLALNQLLKDRAWLAFLIMGLLYNFHAVSVNFFLIPSGIYLLWNFNKCGVKQIIMSAFFFIFMASPVLMWRLQSTPLDLSVHREWFWHLNKGVLNNIFSITSTVPYVLFLNINGIGLLGMFYISSKYLLKKMKLKISTILIVTVSFIIVFIGFLFYEVYPATFLVQFQITRSIIFAVILTYILWTAYIVNQYKNGISTKTNFILRVLVVTLNISPMVTLFVDWFFKVTKKEKAHIFVVLLVAIIGLVSGISIYGSLWRPEIHIYSQKNEWKDAQIWAKNNTEKDTIFITPPEKWWWYEIGWQVESERSNIASTSDLLEIAFVPSFTKYWQSRFEDVAPGAISKFNGNYLENSKMVNRAYYSLNENKILQIANKYRASYFVAENKYTYNFPIVYRNTEYSIYGLIPQK